MSIDITIEVHQIEEYSYIAWSDTYLLGYGFTEEDAVKAILAQLEDVYGCDCAATKAEDQTELYWRKRYAHFFPKLPVCELFPRTKAEAKAFAEAIKR